MKTVPFYNLKITNGFWEERQRTNIEKTLWAVYERFEETGRIKTMDCEAHDVHPHCFWSSDVFKWIEGAAYILEQREDAKILRAVNEIVDMVEHGCSEDGYYNSYYNSLNVQGERFSDRGMHELYTFGHMFEAGVALYHATGNDKLLKICRRSADLIYRVFVEGDSAAFVTPGHEEIELALIRLYHATGEKKYLELSEFFVRQRGNNEKDMLDEYSQAHIPVTEQTECVGHAVRAVYLYCAIADLAVELEDRELFETVERLFNDIYTNKMYITGGIGSQTEGESFTVPYHLPNRTAYTETCATLGLALFCRRLYAAIPDSRYGDVAERAIFNGMISGLSLDGDSFFYTNPLEIDLARQAIPYVRARETQRQKVFGCSCCPPNLVRIIPSIADFIYTYDEKYLYVHQYIANQGTAEGKNVTLTTNYPVEGKIRIVYEGEKGVALRCPSWCREIKTEMPYREEKGYLYFETNCVEIEFVMKPIFYASSDKVHENTGRVALMWGPVVYCIEGQDQACSVFNLQVDVSVPVTVSDSVYGGYPVLYAKGCYSGEQRELYAPIKEETNCPCDIKYIPYYAFANRGEDDMQVWVVKM